MRKKREKLGKKEEKKWGGEIRKKNRKKKEINKKGKKNPTKIPQKYPKKAPKRPPKRPQKGPKIPIRTQPKPPQLTPIMLINPPFPQ